MTFNIFKSTFIVLASALFSFIAPGDAALAHQTAARFDLETLVGQTLRVDENADSAAVRDAIGDAIGEAVSSGSISAGIIANLGLRLSPPRQRPRQNGRLRLYQFHQTVGELPVLGPDAQISIALDANSRVVSAIGGILSESDNLDVTSDVLGVTEVSQLALEAWRTSAASFRHPILGATAENPAIESIVLGIDSFTALPRYDVSLSLNGSYTALVIVSAADGRVLSTERLTANDVFDHRSISVRAHQMRGDPLTSANSLFQLRGSTIRPPGGRCPPAMFGGCLIRMGDDKIIVYDFENSKDANPQPKLRFSSEWTRNPNPPPPIRPSARFVATEPHFQFATQTQFAQLSAAMTALNPLILQAGGWDHYPSAPFLSVEAPPIILFANPPDEFFQEGLPLGQFSQRNFGGQFENFWTHHGHPHFGFDQGVVATRQFRRPYVLFHEIGHFIDSQITLGILGNGLNSRTCQPNTVDEAVPLRETVADIFALYLSKKLYPDLTYTASTVTPENRCRFSAITGNSSSIHHPSCVSTASEVVHFDSERPRPSLTSACRDVQGRRLASVQQALWKVLWGVECSSSPPFSCTAPVSNPVDIMPAIVFALSHSNLMSYRQFFEFMRVFIELEAGSEEGARFRRTMEMHGLL